MIRQALILAGGKGTRLDPLGDYLPKCLATVYNRPLIDYQFRLLESAGVETVYISISARHHAVVQESLRCLERDLHIEILDEVRPAGITALFEAGAQLAAEPFWFVLGDLYYGAATFSPPVLPEGAEALLYTRRYDDPRQLAAETSNIIAAGDQVVRVRDKPAPAQVEGQLGWYATALISPAFLARRQAILDWLAAHHSDAHVGDLFDAALQLGARVAAEPGPEGLWINVNTPDQLLEASLAEQQRQLSEKS